MGEALGSAIVAGLVALAVAVVVMGIAGITALFATGTAKIVAGVIFGVCAFPFAFYALGAVAESVAERIGEIVYRNSLTVLMRAVYEDDAEKVDKLLSKGKDANETKHSLSPLVLACSRKCEKSEEIVRLLLEYGADANLVPPDDKGNPASFSSEIFLMNVRAKDAYALPELPCAPLAYAIGHGDEKIVRLLLENGADADGSKTDGAFLPLQFAIDREEFGCAESLLDFGAKPAPEMGNYSRNGGETLVIAVARKKIRADCSEMRAKILGTLISRGYDINARDAGGKTALHHASEPHSAWKNDGSRAFISHIVGLGADVNAADNEGKTPLMAQMDSRNSGMDNILFAAEFFVAHGADVSLRDNDGKTALDLFLGLHFRESEKDEKYVRIIELLTPEKKAEKKNSAPENGGNASIAKIAKIAKENPETFPQAGRHIMLDDIADIW